MKIKIMHLSKARQINKSRELDLLVNSSLMQRRIIYSCLAVMNPKHDHLEEMSYDDIRNWLSNNSRQAFDLRRYNIEIAEFGKVWGINEKSVLANLKKAVGYDPKVGSSPEIMKMCFRHIKNDKTRFINVISMIEIDQKLGVISIELTDSILPYLINLKSYTMIPFRATLGFKCTHSFTMLEYLLRRYVRGSKYPTHNLSLETLHLVLGTTNLESYKNWSKLKTKVLEPIMTDFSLIVGGGYDLTIEPIYEEKTKGRGRPKVVEVEIKFNDFGVRKFREQSKKQQEWLDYAEETLEDVSSESRILRAKHKLEKQKQKDKKDSKEVLLSDKKAEEQLSLTDLLGTDWEDENLPF